MLPWMANTSLRQVVARWPEGAGRQDCLITVAAPIIAAITLAKAEYAIQSELLAPRPLDSRCQISFCLSPGTPSLAQMQMRLQTAGMKVLALQHLITPCAHAAGPCQCKAGAVLVPRRTDRLLTRLCIVCREFGIWLICSALQFAEAKLLNAPEVQLTDMRGANRGSQWQVQVGALVTAVLRSQPDHRCFWLLKVGVYETNHCMHEGGINVSVRTSITYPLPELKAIGSKRIAVCLAGLPQRIDPMSDCRPR